MDTISKQEYWNNHIRQWRKSGQTKKEYCRDHNLSYWNLLTWQKRLRKMREQEQPLVKVSVGDVQEPSFTGIDIVISNRFTIRLQKGYDTTTLKRVLADIEVQK